uniref:C2H2-type domain-containing protein n=1 Tax=Macrostomum lignano TaxID=282301 RepID=A0A1I8JKT2_9PLAT
MEYWKRVLGRESDPDGRPVKPLREPAVEIEEPISLAECKKALRDLKQTASGPDGVSWSSVKSLGPGWLQYLFNSILACGYPTKSFKNSRTVLIPKTEKPSDPGEFRPLAIASVFGRVFHRILASRLGVWAPLGASQRAFQVNPAKCSTLAIIWDGKNKRWLHDAKGQFKFRGSTLPALGVEESYKYLGLQYGSKGKLKTGLELLKGMLRELKEAPLKPQQRVFLLRTNILPKIMYYLVNGRVHQYTLRECDKCVRRFLREVLHLPHDTPVSAFHACAKDGGLDIDCFESLVPMYKWQKLVSLEEVPDNLVRDLSQLPAIRKRFQLKGAQTSFNNRAEYRMFWKNKLLDNLDGFGLGEAADVPQVHSWVTDGSSLLTGEMYIKCLKIRWNVWPTAARASRGRRQAPLCDAGCRQIEGLGHILQQCNRTWDKRGARHDRIVEFVGSQVERRGFNVIKEKSFATPRGHRRPDLIIYNKDRVWIADVTICADRGAGPMALARDNKIKYYTDEDLATEVAKVAGPGAQSVVGLVWNWRGCCEKKTDEWLKKMGVPIESRRLASVRVLEGSVWCAEVFRKRTGINFAQVGGRNRSDPTCTWSPLLTLNDRSSDQELSNGALATKEGRVCTPAFCTSTSAPGKINATKSSPEDDSRRCRGTATGASTVAAGGIGCAFGYSGPRSLKCLQCEELVKTENEGREHAKSKHLSESVTIWCCKCNAFNRANLKGVVSHWGSCKGPVAVVAPGAGTSSTADSDPGDAAPHVCKFCERAFTTATGLGLHVQKSHKDEHNKALPTKKIFKYEDAEVKDLARAELTLRTKGRVNIELQKMFPHRTVQSIANLRKSEKYRSFLDEARSELEQTPSVASTTDDEVSTLPETVAEEEHQEMAEEPADAEELILEGIKAAINFFVSKYEFGPDSLKREVARYLKEGLVDSDCWSELEPLLKDAWFIKEEHGQKKAKRKPKSKSLPRLKRTGRAFHRREKYAICQKSLDKDFSGTISKILDGVEISEAEVRPEMAKIEEVYQQRLGNTSGALPENTDTPVVEGLRFERKTAPFDAQEVTRAIRESNKSTAAGPDRWFNGRCLKNLDCETVAALFNLWRFKQKIPSALRENRTILLPKGGDLTDANNWRPLTIGSLLLRLYAKSLTTRWSDAPICERQKAFRPVDGCWENINLLLGALKSAHKKRRQINLISIDLAKAFDNIQHGAIFNAMRRMVEITEKFFARQMLAVNLKKCKALRLLPVKGKRTLKVSSDPMLWKGEQLPMVKSIDDFISYLGVKVSVTGKVIWSVDQLRLWLDRVMKAPLKPDQKIKGIKEVLIGRLTYQLRLSEARVCELRRVTRMVRKACKQILHMQLGAPNAWATYRFVNAASGYLTLSSQFR